MIVQDFKTCWMCKGKAVGCRDCNSSGLMCGVCNGPYEEGCCTFDGPFRPVCPTCDNDMTLRDKVVYEREGGDGWPRICEQCAECRCGKCEACK